MSGLLNAIADATGADPRPVWMPEDFLLEQGVGPWVELPFWLPQADNGILELDSRRAFAAGLRIRPLVETVRDADDRGDEAGSAGTLTAEREAELLAAWRRQLRSDSS